MTILQARSILPKHNEESRTMRTMFSLAMPCAVGIAVATVIVRAVVVVVAVGTGLTPNTNARG